MRRLWERGGGGAPQRMRAAEPAPPKIRARPVLAESGRAASPGLQRSAGSPGRSGKVSWPALCPGPTALPQPAALRSGQPACRDAQSTPPCRPRGQAPCPRAFPRPHPVLCRPATLARRRHLSGLAARAGAGACNRLRGSRRAPARQHPAEPRRIGRLDHRPREAPVEQESLLRMPVPPRTPTISGTNAPGRPRGPCAQPAACPPHALQATRSPGRRKARRLAHGDQYAERRAEAAPGVSGSRGRPCEAEQIAQVRACRLAALHLRR